MSDKKKEINKEIPPFSFRKEKPTTKKEKSFTGKLNDPDVPMRRKDKIGFDGMDWFDTHPDA